MKANSEWLEQTRLVTDGTIADDGQGTGTCPLCGKPDKFRFRVGDTKPFVLDCKTCRDPDDDEWTGRARDELVARGVKVPAFGSGTTVDLPSEEELSRWLIAGSHGAGREAIRDLFGLTSNDALAAGVGWCSRDPSGEVLLLIENPDTDELQTVVTRSLNPGGIKSRVAKGTRGSHVYAPFGVDPTQPVYVFGGEKDALAARGFGGLTNVVSFTNGEGAVPPSERLHSLRGCDVVICYDVDAKGQRGQAKVATALLPAANSVRVADLTALADRLPENGDAWDVLTTKGLGRKALRRVLDEAEPWTAEAAEDATYREQYEREYPREKARREVRRELDREEASRHAITLPRLTLREALAAPRPEDPPMRVERLHAIGHNTTITAKYKTGKTTLAGNLLRSLADGDPFLDEFAVKQPEGRILYLNYELTDNDMLDWFEDQVIVHDDRVLIQNLRGVPFTLASEPNQRELIELCRDEQVEVLMLDPHRRAFAGFGSENSNDDVNRFTDVLDVVKREAGVSDLFLFVHTGRGESEPGSEHARGATALDDWADQRWMLTKGEQGQRHMYADGRLPYVPEFTLAHDPATRRLSHEHGSRSDAKREQYRRPVLAALEAAAADGAIVTELQARLDVRKNTALKPILETLVSEGLIVMHPGEKNSKRYYLSQFDPTGAG